MSDYRMQIKLLDAVMIGLRGSGKTCWLLRECSEHAQAFGESARCLILVKHPAQVATMRGNAADWFGVSSSPDGVFRLKGGATVEVQHEHESARHLRSVVGGVDYSLVAMDETMGHGLFFAGARGGVMRLIATASMDSWS